MASSMKSVTFTASAVGALQLRTGSDTGASRGMLASANVTGDAPEAPRSARTNSPNFSNARSSGAAF